MFGLSLMETFFVALIGVIVVAVTNCCDELFNKYYKGIEILKDEVKNLSTKVEEVKKENSELKKSSQKIEEERKSNESEEKELKSLRIRCYMLELELHKIKETIDPQTTSYLNRFDSTNY
jgi:Sec-independent protein translocase protein TatA